MRRWPSLTLVSPRQYLILLASGSPVTDRIPRLATTSGIAQQYVPDRSTSQACANRATCRRTVRCPPTEPSRSPTTFRLLPLLGDTSPGWPHSARCPSRAEHRTADRRLHQTAP